MSNNKMEVDSEVLDVRAALQASSKKLTELDQAQSGVESTQQMDLGNLLMFSYENVAPEELDQKAVELTQTLVGMIIKLEYFKNDLRFDLYFQKIIVTVIRGTNLNI